MDVTEIMDEIKNDGIDKPEKIRPSISNFLMRKNLKCGSTIHDRILWPLMRFWSVKAQRKINLK